ncbi:endonuclease domain-containing 1 protein-like [Sardina pilchardus]|uniref:endonuclease domain-containing 1 protein-like n=1 Tax=Sardina pilchardus TaxID=27697 RepID=UPI002E12044F
MDQNARKICQQHGYGYLYASLYSTSHRIPVYSAYIFDPGCDNKGGRKSGEWFIEPKLSGISEDSMQPERNYRDTIKQNQAVNDDYRFSGYDRGHLNPNSFHCGEDGRTATFTLTNAAPMDACFNRVHWKDWEKGVKDILKAEPPGVGTAYLVTGTVVDASGYRIPRRGEFDGDSTREYNRVTVPTHIWTAVCYKHHLNDEESYSFGFIGKNQPDSNIMVETVPQLNRYLSKLHGSGIKIFTDDCFSTNRKSEENVKRLYREIRLPMSDKLHMSDDALNTFHTAMSQFNDLHPLKRPKVTGMTILESFDSLETWFKTTETMKYLSGSACVLSQPISALVKTVGRKELRKRDTAEDSAEVVCSLVPEEASDCTSSCLYKEEAGGYYCYYGNTERSCSPVYSMMTVAGTRCNSDHTCGKHGTHYYWCNVGSSWEYCSPPLPLGKGRDGHYCRSDHNCGWYGHQYTWCYTDYDGNWDFCCSSDSRYSAEGDKTCKSDSPCSLYYSMAYFSDIAFCDTIGGSWARCCTP